MNDEELFWKNVRRKGLETNWGVAQNWSDSWVHKRAGGSLVTLRDFRATLCC